MVFNDTINEQGIVQEIDDICNSDNNSYPIKRKTRRANQALDRYFSIAMKTDGRWEEDSSNYTDFPIATSDIDENRIQYTFPEDLLEVFRVEFKDETGLWRQLIPIDQSDYKGQASDEFMKTPSQPLYYDKKYGSLWLYPASNKNIEDGLKIHYNRKLEHFKATDTNKKAGIPSIFATYLARYASLPFLIEKGKSTAKAIADLIVVDEKEVEKYYSRRSRDEKTRILPRRTNNFI